MTVLWVIGVVVEVADGEAVCEQEEIGVIDVFGVSFEVRGNLFDYLLRPTGCGRYGDDAELGNAELLLM